MKKYYIIRPDGSSIFCLPYSEDFCIHCLFLLQNDGQVYRLLDSSIQIPFFVTCDGTLFSQNSSLGG